MSAEPFSPVQSDLPEGGEHKTAAYGYPSATYGEPSTPADPATRTLYLAKRAVHAILCIAIPLGIWALIIRWSTESVVQQINEQTPQHDLRTHVKKLEFREFDVEGFRKSMGIQSE